MKQNGKPKPTDNRRFEPYLEEVRAFMSRRPTQLASKMGDYEEALCSFSFLHGVLLGRISAQLVKMTPQEHQRICAPFAKELDDLSNKKYGK